MTNPFGKFAAHDLQHVACDIDGVLCRNPTIPDDDGPEYAAFLAGAVPLYLPPAPIGVLITCRLERWRDLTEKWLRQHGVKWGKLVMYPAGSAAERRAECTRMSERGPVDGYGRWKAEMVVENGCFAMFESNARQARMIASECKRQVVCVEDGKVYWH